MSGGKISKDLIDLVPHYKESPLVKKAMQDLERIFGRKTTGKYSGADKNRGNNGKKSFCAKSLKGA